MLERLLPVHSLVIRPAAALLGVALAACGPDRVASGTGVGNPPVGAVTLSFKAAALTSRAPIAKAAAWPMRFLSASPSPSSLPAGAAAKSGLGMAGASYADTLHDARGRKVVVDSLRLGPKNLVIVLPDSGDCGNASEPVCRESDLIVRGPFEMDLLTGSSHPELPEVSLPEGDYRTVRLEFEEGGESRQGLRLRGRFWDSPEESREFLLTADMPEDLSFTPSRAFRVAGDSANRITVVVDPSQWLSTVDLAACGEESSDDEPLYVRRDGSCREELEDFLKDIDEKAEYEED